MGYAEDVKKIIYTKIAMAINTKGLKTENLGSLELSLRKSGDFARNELDIVFGEKPQSYHDELERQRKKRLGLISDDEEDPKKESAYSKAQAKKKQKELDAILKEAGN
jgi:hypothetical protein